jgi:hypothetical protein
MRRLRVRRLPRARSGRSHGSRAPSGRPVAPTPPGAAAAAVLIPVAPGPDRSSARSREVRGSSAGDRRRGGCVRPLWLVLVRNRFGLEPLIWVKTEPSELPYMGGMLAQSPMLPPAVQRIVTTPVLASERPAGFRQVKIIRLPPNRRARTLGAVSIQFSNGHSAEQTNDALLATHAAAVRFAGLESRDPTVGPFHVRAVAVRRFAVVVMAYTATGAKTLLALAVAHLRRSEGWN